ncbi:TonB-dependent receptor [Phenylobacterium montanum]|uniref:TonB-dependent receptor n=1 Tax=Phenylobacterium montanum TaxID=2823693 RepID=A0A975IWS0_9CAUL|nr:TonB-dependent receptor [Caulobacter sp. S6]QUD90135.1 TonB-dependent receptor [Caulobacter sp. S6]
MNSSHQVFRSALFLGAATFALACGSAPAVAASPDPQAYDLKSQGLETSLRVVALKSGRPILAPSRLLAGRKAPPLKGRYTAIEAYRALLAGSGLTLAEVGETVVVRAANGPDEAAAPKDEPQSTEIVVTGSRIRGAPPAAPVRTLDRTDIERSGYADVGEVVRSLPENFAGGQNPGVLAGAAVSNVGNQNTTNASSVNLRGLGSDATLVLVDGHRIAADGAFQAPDISAIPMAAIQRIEIVTDGASALYGSDAVAGVANFILRKDYDGAEFSERIGGATDGGGLQQTYSALGGRIWSSGHALVSIQYTRQDAIKASQRDFTVAAPPVDDLLQPQTQIAAFANLGQDLAPWASLHLDGLYSDRRTGFGWEEEVGGFFYNQSTRAQAYLAAPELDLTLPGSWTGSIAGALSGSDDPAPLTYAGGFSGVRYRNAAQSVEAGASGPVIDLPGGALKLALGGGYRHETFGYHQTGQPVWTGAREVSYFYGELSAPLIGPGQDVPGVHALDLTLAGRAERYSDFGATTNPKVGLRYKPLDGAVLRATWGTSFKAPQLIQTAESNTLFYYPAAQLGGTTGTALLTYGGNPNLKPERSNAWTAGVDLSPPQRPSLRLSATYFHIDYTGRIVQPVNDLGSALTSPTYAPFVTPNPSVQLQAAAIANAAAFYNLAGTPYDASDVVALVQDRYVNATAQKISGVDLSVSDRFDLAGGGLDLQVDATWLRIVQQTTVTAPSAGLTGTLFNPPKFRLRGTAVWTRGPLTLSGALNHIAGEADTGVTPAVPIAAWTTADLTGTWRFQRPAGRLTGLEVSLAVLNLFDKDPPFARGAGAQLPGVNFDSTNASAIGRFVALTLRQRF